MFKKPLLIGFTIGLVLLGCSDDSPVLITLNQQFEAQEAELVTLELAGDQGYIELQVLEINESRCPSDVVCVRFGEAMVEVGVTGTQEILKILDLCIGDCPQRGGEVIITDTVSVEIDNISYAVILKDVVPYPTTSNQDQAKQAILEVIPN